MSALSAWPRFNSRRPSCRAAPAESVCCANAVSGVNSSATTNRRLTNFLLISLPFRIHEELKIIYESGPGWQRESSVLTKPSSPATAVDLLATVPTHEDPHLLFVHCRTVAPCQS